MQSISAGDFLTTTELLPEDQQHQWTQLRDQAVWWAYARQAGTVRDDVAAATWQDVATDDYDRWPAFSMMPLSSGPFSYQSVLDAWERNRHREHHTRAEGWACYSTDSGRQVHVRPGCRCPR